MALNVPSKYKMSTICPPPAMLVKIIGGNIALRRKALDMTQNDLAKALSYSRRQMGRIERGEESLPAELLPIVAETLKIKNPLKLMEQGAFDEWI